jgi:hypothetical protein
LYKIDDKYSLETDGKTTTIGVKQFDIRTTYDYFSALKLILGFPHSKNHQLAGL